MVFRISAVSLALLIAAGAAGADTIDFEGLEHGRIVDTQIAGVTIGATNLGGGPDLAIVFDSRERRTRDRDLEGPFSGGNLAPDTPLGNLLVIAENAYDCDGDGLIDHPDDEGSKPAGSIRITFDEPVFGFGLDLVDVEDTALENGALVFHDGLGGSAARSFDTFVARDATIAWGNNSANRVVPFTAAELGLDAIVGVDVNMGGSGAIDNLETISPTPEPGTLLLVGLGAAGLAWRRRRRPGA